MVRQIEQNHHTTYSTIYAKFMIQLRTFGEMAVVAIHEGKRCNPSWTIEEKHVCLLDMQMIILEMYTDS